MKFMRHDHGLPPLRGCELEIPEAMLKEWQSIVDLLARIGAVRAALIMRKTGEDLEVFLASRPAHHPYRVGERTRYRNSGLYCERVLQQGAMLEVPNAGKDEAWRENPDMKYGMSCYLGFPIRLPGGGFFGTICMLDDKENHFSRDIKEFLEKMWDLIESYLLLIRLSDTDQLTGVHNRTYFDRRLEQEMGDARREGRPLAAMLLDIDHFKKVNDRLGHLEGDRVLREFAEILTASLRSTDAVFRFGGDEFCVLMPDTGAEEAAAVAEKVRRAVETSEAFPQFPLTTSVGVAVCFVEESYDDWFRRVDQALYRAKRLHGNRVMS